MSDFKRHQLITGLFNAISNGTTDDVRGFIEDDGADPNFRNKDDLTALMYAVREGRHQMVDILLKAGANPNAKHPSSRNTALHYAAQNNNYYAMALLLHHGAQVDVHNIHLQTPLHRAASRGAYDCLMILLKSDANIHSKDSLHRTPLQLALLGQEKMRKSLSREKSFDATIERLNLAENEYKENILKKQIDKQTEQNIQHLRQKRKNRKNDRWRLG